ncbi:tripartite tricarboxylate transporter substrate binding protein [Roseomonas alkaliterrae]|uniref:Tripartite-type tricarboxylate transporter receptor subunit TctC n=1 Tax=Neoroseomonas alkaliterrae TaxID=1452450 RepID=A0A840Y7H9_9PROT|nr:tripartite tricarboxylate transporter substrate binding protein [Neoroseomonas alkaliterrae]MBB5689834.1 tripartite-type tricarboxylate transporter receptor subunit TctC [Neoroseomonas alkaliterrae]MBR0675138.1 tripartite tricarboxylate transporter substrate binding protein [Neoroseomonas alkaliterrae]
MIRLPRRALLSGAALLAAPTVRAQGAWPGSQPVSVVIPYAAGGATDVVARLLLDGLAARTGGTFIMDHKPGASTTIAARHVARARPDGMTLLLGTNVTFTTAPHALRTIGFDPLEDFAHVTLLAEPLFLLVAHPRWGSLAALLAAAKERPGALSYATWGVGSTSHLGMVDLCARAGVEMLHVPFNGAPPALTETIAGRTDAMMSTFAPARPQVEGGRVAALGIPSPRRAASLPSVPTIAEQGFPDFTVSGWFSLSAPKGTPEPILERLGAAAAEAFASPQAAATYDRLGFVQATPGREVMIARLRREFEQNRELMQRAGIRPE